ncbi:hypothetical protein MPTK1_6g13080 [Marchantia polymorpha subsp. ruderalis]|uniref:Uncharacterized protein n=2 Tax=Marchantia polymorpha TaxID=3197 RepID=A0AAF6BRJ5_MARPO|nr:hypothetical protein MARPO_0059s0042 [Marchantia polymorpha]BBN14629.1 hypothetical protein Mp_6g13080 [Marchantia polymorpha subsp. ruderalis]|eukprot:PTQ37094.1 hypothetical protein MARPO_0059s0042 [Marchantia polymorpha]
MYRQASSGVPEIFDLSNSLLAPEAHGAFGRDSAWFSIVLYMSREVFTARYVVCCQRAHGSTESSDRRAIESPLSFCLSCEPEAQTIFSAVKPAYVKGFFFGQTVSLTMWSARQFLPADSFCSLSVQYHRESIVGGNA